MVFLTKCSIFFLVLFTTAIGDDDSGDSDDDALKQALFLVNVLKSDYAKILRSGAKVTEPPTDDPSTCPLTTKNSSDLPDTTPAANTNEINPTILTTSSPTPPPPPVQTQSPGSTTEEPWITYSDPFEEKSGEQLTYNEEYPLYDMLNRKKNKNNAQWRKFRKYRRLMPLEYFYYDVPIKRRAFRVRRRGPSHSFRRRGNRNLRRMGADDIDLNSTAENSEVVTTDPTASPLSTASPPESTASPVSSASPPESTTSTQESTASPSATTVSTSPLLSTESTLPPLLKTNSKASGKPINKKAPKISRTTPKDWTKSPATENVVYPQVARELLNELNGGGLTMEPPTTRSKGRFRPASRSKNKSQPKGAGIVQQQPDVIKGFNAFKRRSTLRIHMDRSTRLSLPLSENNAYCFLNPKSPLCRTDI